MMVKQQKLSNDVRVIIERTKPNEYRIAAQEYTPNGFPWEGVRPDGWRDTSATYSSGLEAARRQFDQMVRSEQRWLEMR